MDSDGRPYKDDLGADAGHTRDHDNNDGGGDRESQPRSEDQSVGSSEAEWQQDFAKRQRWQHHRTQRKQRKQRPSTSNTTSRSANANHGQPRSPAQQPSRMRTSGHLAYEETSFLVKIVGMYRIQYHDNARETTFRVIAMENLAYSKGPLSENKNIQVRSLWRLF